MDLVWPPAVVVGGNIIVYLAAFSKPVLLSRTDLKL